MKRIDPSKTPDLYRRIGMRPVQNDWCSPDGSCGCLVTALMVDAGTGAREFAGASGRGERAAKRLGFDEKYVCGLIDGFDMFRCFGSSQEYNAGHVDGLAVWEALVEAGMTETKP